jgi:hypothetical protein
MGTNANRQSTYLVLRFSQKSLRRQPEVSHILLRYISVSALMPLWVAVGVSILTPLLVQGTRS